MKVPKLLICCLILAAIVSCKKTILNKVPVADAGPAQTTQLPDNSVTLTGTGTDADGTIVGYLWSMVTGPNIPHIHEEGSPTTLISGLITGTYIFQLMVVDEDGATGLDTVSVVVTPATAVTLSLQPGADGQDALVITKDGDAAALNMNFGQHTELNYSKWTYGAQGFGEGPMQSYIRFTGLTAIPQTAHIISAKLSFYGVATSAFTPQGNSHYAGSPYGSDSANAGWVKSVTGTWDETTITWANKPGTSEFNKVAIRGTTAQWNFNVTDIDVTAIVQTMISTDANYGFWIGLQNETIYRNVIFSSSEATDSARRPKLVVVYE